MSEFILFAILITLFVMIIFLLTYYLIQRFYKQIWIPYKKSISGHSFEDLLIILKAVINSELDAYENDVFRMKGSLTNSNFNQFYIDISKKITQDLPDSFMQELTKYLTDDAVLRIIARDVKKFLEEHIHGTY